MRLALVAATCAVGCSLGAGVSDGSTGSVGVYPADHLLLEPERAHLSNLRQLTFGGTNAESYWAFDDSQLICQITQSHRADGTRCDQIFRLDVSDGELTQLTDAGRTTCAFFLPDSERVLFGSTHAGGVDCPPEPDKSKGYVWAVYDSYEIYSALPDGSDLVNISDAPGYDAEATVSRQGRVVFTSTRSGDLELWTMEPDGSDKRQVTDRLGYDGGAFFNNAGDKLVWRSTRFDSEAERAEYRELLSRGLVKPTRMELWIANADGSDMRQLTDNGAANFAPFFTPDDRSILFSSNMAGGPGSFDFDLYLMDLETGEIEQVTHSPLFDSFPMFSWDGQQLAFTSRRGPADGLNVFVADWTP